LVYARRFGPIATLVVTFLLRNVSRLWQHPLFWMAVLLVSVLWVLGVAMTHRPAVAFVAEAPEQLADTKRVPPGEWHQDRLGRTVGVYAASADGHVRLDTGHGGSASDVALVEAEWRYVLDLTDRTSAAGRLNGGSPANFDLYLLAPLMSAYAIGRSLGSSPHRREVTVWQKSFGETDFYDALDIGYLHSAQLSEARPLLKFDVTSKADAPAEAQEGVAASPAVGVCFALTKTAAAAFPEDLRVAHPNRHRLVVVRERKLDLRAREASELVLALHAEIDRFVAAHRRCCPGPPTLFLRGPGAFALGLGLRLAKDAGVVFVTYDNVEKRYVGLGSDEVADLGTSGGQVAPGTARGRDTGE
jgi:hypothetical protein